MIYDAKQLKPRTKTIVELFIPNNGQLACITIKSLLFFLLQ